MNDVDVRIRDYERIPIRGRDIVCIYEWCDEDGLAHQAHELCILFRHGGKICHYDYELVTWRKELAAAMAQLGLEIDVEELANTYHAEYYSCVHYPEEDRRKAFFLPGTPEWKKLLHAPLPRPRLLHILPRAGAVLAAWWRGNYHIPVNYDGLSFGEELRRSAEAGG